MKLRYIVLARVANSLNLPKALENTFCKYSSSAERHFFCLLSLLLVLNPALPYEIPNWNGAPLHRYQLQVFQYAEMVEQHNV